MTKYSESNPLNLVVGAGFFVGKFIIDDILFHASLSAKSDKDFPCFNVLFDNALGIDLNGFSDLDENRKNKLTLKYPSNNNVLCCYSLNHFLSLDISSRGNLLNQIWYPRLSSLQSKAIVLCSDYSRQNKIFDHCLNSVKLDYLETQQKILAQLNHFIAYMATKGPFNTKLKEELCVGLLNALFNYNPNATLVLGCTELYVLDNPLYTSLFPSITIINPLKNLLYKELFNEVISNPNKRPVIKPTTDFTNFVSL